LTAVVQGIQASGLQTKCLRKYGKLVDPTGGYQAYRSGMGESPSLHFLLPALTALARNDLAYAELVSTDLALYTEKHCYPKSGMHVKHTAAPKAYGHLGCAWGKEKSLTESTLWTILTACFGC
jgi:hypothetical protein